MNNITGREDLPHKIRKKSSFHQNEIWKALLFIRNYANRLSCCPLEKILNKIVKNMYRLSLWTSFHLARALIYFKANLCRNMASLVLPAIGFMAFEQLNVKVLDFLSRPLVFTKEFQT